MHAISSIRRKHILVVVAISTLALIGVSLTVFLFLNSLPDIIRSCSAQSLRNNTAIALCKSERVNAAQTIVVLSPVLITIALARAWIRQMRRTHLALAVAIVVLIVIGVYGFLPVLLPSM